MKRAATFLFVLTGLLTGYSVMAQTRMTEEEKDAAIQRYLDFQEKLNLTEEQKPQVEEINTSFFKGLADLRNSSASRLDKYRTYKDLSAKRDKQMKEVLTKDQYKMFKDFQAETKENLRERRRANQR